jgi:hypothetical protein
MPVYDLWHELSTFKAENRVIVHKNNSNFNKLIGHSFLKPEEQTDNSKKVFFFISY